MASESYEIRTADGKLFCKCQNNDGDVRLVGKNCSMSIRHIKCGSLAICKPQSFCYHMTSQMVHIR